ncbi:hypothetical protein HDU67_004374 [Dinochytrium kinnereticum]|nr:hypothetical protein HDU67_004374 [Dinochytrium kinnereticum]
MTRAPQPTQAKTAASEPQLPLLHDHSDADASIANHIQDLHNTLNSLIENGRRREEIWQTRRKSSTGSTGLASFVNAASASHAAKGAFGAPGSPSQQQQIAFAHTRNVSGSSLGSSSLTSTMSSTSETELIAFLNAAESVGLPTQPGKVVEDGANSNPSNPFSSSFWEAAPSNSSLAFGSTTPKSSASSPPSSPAVASVPKALRSKSISSTMSNSESKPSLFSIGGESTFVLSSSNGTKTVGHSGDPIGLVNMERRKSTSSGILKRTSVGASIAHESLAVSEKDRGLMALDVEIPASFIDINDGILAELTTSIEAAPGTIDASAKRLSSSGTNIRGVQQQQHQQSIAKKRSSVRSSLSSNSTSVSSAQAIGSSLRSNATIAQSSPLTAQVGGSRLSSESSRFSIDFTSANFSSSSVDIPNFLSRPSLDAFRPSLDSLCPAGAPEDPPPLPTTNEDGSFGLFGGKSGSGAGLTGLKSILRYSGSSATSSKSGSSEFSDLAAANAAPVSPPAPSSSNAKIPKGVASGWSVKTAFFKRTPTGVVPTLTEITSTSVDLPVGRRSLDSETDKSQHQPPPGRRSLDSEQPRLTSKASSISLMAPKPAPRDPLPPTPTGNGEPAVRKSTLRSAASSASLASSYGGITPYLPQPTYDSLVTVPNTTHALLEKLCTSTTARSTPNQTTVLKWRPRVLVLTPIITTGEVVKGPKLYIFRHPANPDDIPLGRMELGSGAKVQLGATDRTTLILTEATSNGAQSNPSTPTSAIEPLSLVSSVTTTPTTPTTPSLPILSAASTQQEWVLRAIPDPHLVDATAAEEAASAWVSKIKEAIAEARGVARGEVLARANAGVSPLIPKLKSPQRPSANHIGVRMDRRTRSAEGISPDSPQLQSVLKQPKTSHLPLHRVPSAGSFLSKIQTDEHGTQLRLHRSPSTGSFLPKLLAEDLEPRKSVSAKEPEFQPLKLLHTRAGEESQALPPSSVMMGQRMGGNPAATTQSVTPGKPPLGPGNGKKAGMAGAFMALFRGSASSNAATP